jgi:hypothetical protein
MGVYMPGALTLGALMPGALTAPNLLGMESLETRKLKLDMQFAYKILFGIVDRDYSTMFSLNAAQRTRGHNYKLYVQRNCLQSRKHFFSNRIVKSCQSTSNPTILFIPF